MNYYPYERSSVRQVYHEWFAFDLTIDEQDNSQRVFSDGSFGTTVHTFKKPHTVTRKTGTISVFTGLYPDVDERTHLEYIPIRGSRRKGFKIANWQSAQRLFVFEVNSLGRVMHVYKYDLERYTSPCGRIFLTCTDIDGCKLMLLKDGIGVKYPFSNSFCQRKLDGNKYRHIPVAEVLPYTREIERGVTYAG